MTNRAQNALSGKARSERGQSLVELALVLPILMFLLLIVVDFGRVYYQYIAVVSAARVAAEVGSDSTTSDAAITGAAANEIAGNNVPITTAIAPSPSRSAGSTVVVTVTSTFQPITPFIQDVISQTTGSPTINVQHAAQGRTY